MISIVIPVYNAENYIEACVESVLNQTFTDWELLLVENGSTDSSRERCERLAAGDERIRLLPKEANTGVSEARNLGMEESKGEWITFLDADDRVKSDFLEVLWGLKEETHGDMVVCGYECIPGKPGSAEREGEKSLVGEAGKGKHPERREGGLPPYQIYNQKSYLKDYLLEGNTHCWGILYERKLVKTIRFPKCLSIGEDMLFLIDGALAAEKIVVTDYAGYEYLVHTGGAMEKPFTLSYMDQITCWYQALDKLVVLYPRLGSKVESILLVSVLLVVGKLARLPRKEQKLYTKEEAYCRSLVKEFNQKKEIFSYLPSGYFLKVKLYRYFPKLYLAAYGRWKG